MSMSNLIGKATVWPEEGDKDLLKASPSVEVRSGIKPDPPQLSSA